ncbi:hypothetical protein BH09PAT2_BH09PAT2_02310 [soil metagenome]
MSIQISCIIPFYNEAPRINKTIEKLSRSIYFSQIICVDDGSTDNPYIDAKKYGSRLTLITLDINKGKSDAIFEGLKKAKQKLIFIIDADLKELNLTEINVACEKMIKNPYIDMLILRSNKAYWTTWISRHDILFSGQRLIKKYDLNQIFQLKPQHYEIEIAANSYMIEHKKEVRFSYYSGLNTLKTEKVGFIQGTWNNLKMLKSILIYEGITRYLSQVLFFCHRELK